MKKLLMNFGDNVMSKKEMKAIAGGVAASASADCPDGRKVECTGVSCSSTDGDRCSCTQAGGGVEVKVCTATPPPLPT